MRKREKDFWFATFINIILAFGIFIGSITLQDPSWSIYASIGIAIIAFSILEFIIDMVCDPFAIDVVTQQL